jgi:hypothetical protein
MDAFNGILESTGPAEAAREKTESENASSENVQHTAIRDETLRVPIAPPFVA